MAEPFHRGQLKTVVVAVRAGGELRHCSESRIGRLHVGERRKTALAYGLVTVHLGRVRLVYGARADVLRLQTGRRSELMFYSQAPFHEVRRMEFAIWNSRDRNRWKRGLALGKSRSKSLIRGKECADCAVGRSRCDGCAARTTKHSSLKRLIVGRIRADQIGHRAR